MQLRFDEDSHTYWLGDRRIPGVTSITGQLDDFAGIPPAILERKSQIGKAAHAAAEIINKGGEVEPSSVHESVAGYVEGYQLFLSEHECTVVLAEQKVFSERFMFAGQLDVVFRMHNRLAGFWEAGQLWMPDLKTVAQLRPSTRVQTAGYRLALPDLGVPRSAIGRGAIQLKPNGTYHLEAHHSAADEQCFLSLLNVYNWRAANE